MSTNYRPIQMLVIFVAPILVLDRFKQPYATNDISTFSASGIQHISIWHTSMQYPAFQRPASSIQHPTPSIQHLVPGIQHPASSMTVLHYLSHLVS